MLFAAQANASAICHPAGYGSEGMLGGVVGYEKPLGVKRLCKVVGSGADGGGFRVAAANVKRATVGMIANAATRETKDGLTEGSGSSSSLLRLDAPPRSLRMLGCAVRFQHSALRCAPSLGVIDRSSAERNTDNPHRPPCIFSGCARRTPPKTRRTRSSVPPKRSPRHLAGCEHLKLIF